MQLTLSIRLHGGGLGCTRPARLKVLAAHPLARESWFRRSLKEPAAASAAAAAGGSADAGAAPGDEAPPASANSSNGGSEAAGPADAAAGTSGGLAFSLPARAMPTAGAIFCLAGVLKLLIMCFPYSTISVMMFLQGRADLGILGVAKMLPIALGLACLAKAMLDRRLHTRPWAQRSILLGAVAALLLSRWIFARPRPSVLDPMLHAMHRQHVAAMAAEQQQLDTHQRRSAHLLHTPSEEHRRHLKSQQVLPQHGRLQ